MIQYKTCRAGSSNRTCSAGQRSGRRPGVSAGTAGGECIITTTAYCNACSADNRHRVYTDGLHRNATGGYGITDAGNAYRHAGNHAGRAAHKGHRSHSGIAAGEGATCHAAECGGATEAY